MDENTLTPAKLREMMRKFDALMLSDDVIAVSMLFLPDKALEFVDDKGKVYAMGTAMWHRLKAQAVPTATLGATAPGLLGSVAPFGGMRVVFEHDGIAWSEVVDRILRSMRAGEEQSSYLSRLALELKLTQGSPEAPKE